ncbi:MAG: hypothetical protein RLZZ37_507 [Actinomycetota bacterium]|jgi:glycosyltransferase involved in cell wall biosynthesis
MIKVLHLVPAYSPSKGGIETLLSNLIEIFEQNNIKNMVISDTKNDNFTLREVNSVIIQEIPFTTSSTTKPFNLKKMLECLSRLNQVIEQYDPDIFHIHGATFVSAWYAVRTLNKFRNIKVIVTQHGVIENGDSTKAYFELLNRAHTLVGVSNQVLESAKKFKYVKNSVECVISNGVKISNEFTIKWPFSTTLNILLIGRLDHEKGFDIGINAAGELNKHFDTSLVIIGQGILKQDFLDLAKSLNLKIKIITDLPNPKVHAYIREADFVWVPSRTREGFSLAAAEAGINGVPVICSTTGGLTETVIDGITGLVCKSNKPAQFTYNTLKYIDNNFESDFIIKSEVSDNIKKISKSRFDLLVCAKKYIKVYEEMVRNGAKKF